MYLYNLTHTISVFEQNWDNQQQKNVYANGNLPQF